MSYNLNYLEAFLSLSDTLSFTQTAKALGLSQPSVSRQILLLEEQLKTRLFIRDRNKVHLSPAGIELKTRVSPLVKDVFFALGQTHENSSSLQGTISVGALSEIGQSTFMSSFLEFQKHNPEVALWIEYANSDDIKRKIKAGILDFGIVSNVDDSDNMRSYPLLQERVVLVSRAQNKSALSQEANFVLYRKGDPLYESYFRMHGKKLGLSNRRPYVIVNSHRSMVEALLASDCYAVLPYLSAKNLIDEVKLKIVSSHELKNPIFLACLQSQHSDRRSTLFRKHILQFAKAFVG